MNRRLIYYLIFLIGSSCILSKKEQITIEKKESITYKPSNILGDTSTSDWIPNCEYIVEDISKKIEFPDSLKSKSFSQNPEVGDTIKGKHYFKISLFFEEKNKVDTLFYKVNFRCGSSDVPQFISPNGGYRSDVWSIPFLEDYPNNVVKVFNRWGNLVFEEKRYYTGWQGTTNIKRDSTNKLMDNKMLPEGTYFYIIDFGEESLDPLVGYLQIKR